MNKDTLIYHPINGEDLASNCFPKKEAHRRMSTNPHTKEDGKRELVLEKTNLKKGLAKKQSLLK